MGILSVYVSEMNLNSITAERLVYHYYKVFSEHILQGNQNTVTSVDMKYYNTRIINSVSQGS